MFHVMILPADLFQHNRIVAEKSEQTMNIGWSFSELSDESFCFFRPA